jgi:hypothetical protein
MSTERGRVETFGGLEDGLWQASDWYHWGPYLTERQWGTVREDYSANGSAWDYLPHDDARSRAYRWGEDGLAGFSDVEQRLCIALALWNGRDPILKERIFGLTGTEGNHGEDAKEYWWYLDALPSHAWNRWRYHYPQGEFPYSDLVTENRRRGKLDPEYELLDTGAFDDDRYWIVEVCYAKADAHDLLMSISITNAGPETASLSVLPTVWYRNTWQWDEQAVKPELLLHGERRLVTEHPVLGPLEIVSDGDATVLFCDNDTNQERIFGCPSETPFPKDGINDHVVHGAATVGTESGTKASFRHEVTVEAGETAIVRVRLRPPSLSSDPWQGFDRVVEDRRADADEFYAELTPQSASADEAAVLRQSLAGMLWSKQLFYYDVARWLDGDAAQPAPPEARLRGRNAGWRSFDAADIMSMPDKWEYPWFAAWDLAFHCVSLAHVDPAFAKYQLILLCREWFQHPNGALAAYEWSFDDVNPPVQAWAALEVFAIDGARDFGFLSRVFDKLMVNFTWWINREDPRGSNLFEGGFLGLDNIGPIDRSHLPPGFTLEQADSTGWMGFYALSMAAIAALLNSPTRPTRDLVVKFVEQFARISEALETQRLWDEEDGFFYDRLIHPDGSTQAVKVRSMVGILPFLAVAVVRGNAVGQTRALNKRGAALIQRRQEEIEQMTEAGVLPAHSGDGKFLLGVVGVGRVLRLFERLFDEKAFLSPYGLRAVSRFHVEHPFHLDIDGSLSSIEYEPGESSTGMFGGNSNWRGPIWMPVNYLVISALERYARILGDDMTIEYPSRSGVRMTMTQIAADLRRRLISLFLVGPDGRRPCFGSVEPLQTDPAWKDNLLFFEYFHGDDGTGLGASHQTGWTGLVADLIIRCHGRHVPTIGEMIEAGILEMSQSGRAATPPGPTRTSSGST